jgi:hypothetical protein
MGYFFGFQMSNRVIDPGVSVKTYDILNFVRKVIYYLVSIHISNLSCLYMINVFESNCGDCL